MIPKTIVNVMKTAFKRWQEASLTLMISLLAWEGACAQTPPDPSQVSHTQEEAGEHEIRVERARAPGRQGDDPEGADEDDRQERADEDPDHRN